MTALKSGSGHDSGGGSLCHQEKGRRTSHLVLDVAKGGCPQVLRDPRVAAEVWKADTHVFLKTDLKLIDTASYIQI